MSRRLVILSLFAVGLLSASACVGVAEISAKKCDQGVAVEIDGQPFTTYVVDSGLKPELGPILWPIIGPTGKPVTRAHPMAEGPTEREDHPHHRSLWFNHGDVNGLSFWHVDTIRHREFVRVESGAQAVIVTRNDWIAPDGKRICEDQRTLTFGVEGDTRRIDFDITLRATDGPVTFGDTKEGTMGVRVAGTMKVDAKLGGKIVNSAGQVDRDAWGKQAAWVDYHGPIDGQTVGIAILNHPSSFRFPTYWHVRTYGLFAANPFGRRRFTGSDDQDGTHTLAPGESISLSYRFLVHKGDEKEAKLSEAFDAYSAKPR
ncbi:MAG: PmoA family protein [Planctomycetes bacterium]|nr:PmoA family protein [Planctomycetota bacterium]